MGAKRRYWGLCGGLARGGLCFLLLSTGCEEEVITRAPVGGPTPGAAKPAASAAQTNNAADDVAPPQVEFQEEDFSETERSRDPFRSFQEVFVEKTGRSNVQRARVLLEEYALDDLKLIGVISRIVPAKAMVVDPTGKGHVIHRNDLVGRAERVQAAASPQEFEVNWRVERIRESDVVFVREDPTNPDVPSATRVLSLRAEGEPN